MSISCGDFLESAKKLLSGTAEVDFRNAASRAYYAAYHACLPIGEALPDFADVAGGEHLRLITKLENCPTKGVVGMPGMSVRSLGYRLRQIRELRARADYELTKDFRRNESELVIEVAKDLVDKTKSVAAK